MEREWSTEFVSDEYLHINSCDCQHLAGTDFGSFRPEGRKDFHILFVAEGCLFVNEGEKEYPAAAGSAVIYLPGEPQQYHCRADIPTVSYYVHFSGTGCTDLLNRLNLSGKRIYNVGESASLTAAFDRLVDEFCLRRPYFEICCAGYLIRVLSLIARRVGDRSRWPDRKARYTIYEVCKYILKNYAQEKTVAEYAELCCLSESRFSHLFRDTVGCSPSRYVIRTRVNKAKELLENTDLSMGQIAEGVGVPDPNYFCRIFRKQTGFTPTDFRRLAQNCGPDDPDMRG